jgi:formiminotetrahydrofolate cyclodeaminase
MRIHPQRAGHQGVSQLQGSLEQFLEQVARRGSWIGGGAVAACSAALAAALLEKLVHAPAASQRLRRIRRECFHLVEADARSFAAVIRTLRDNDPAVFRRSLKAATEIPYRVFVRAKGVEGACRAARRRVKPRYQSDLICATTTARGAAEAAQALIRTNLAWLNDARYAARMRRRLQSAERHVSGSR